MHVDPWVRREPLANLESLVGGVVIHHQMQFGAGAIIGIDLRDVLEETQELLVAMAWLGEPGDLAGCDFQRREQRGGAVSDVVMGAPLGRTGFHRQRRLGAVQCLNLGLLVHTQHDCVLRRRQIEPHDVGDLRGQLRVGGELESPGPPRLHPVVTPRSGHGRVVDPESGRQQPRGPVRDTQFLRRRLQRLRNDLGVIDPTRPTRPCRVVKPVKTLGLIAFPTRDHRLTSDTDPMGDLAIGQSLGGQQHDPRPLRETSSASRGT